jgi:hypothetical protein
VNEIDTEPPTATDDGDTLDTTIDGPTTSLDPPVTVKVASSFVVFPALSEAVNEIVYVPDGIPDDGNVHSV